MRYICRKTVKVNKNLSAVLLSTRFVDFRCVTDDFFFLLDVSEKNNNSNEPNLERVLEKKKKTLFDLVLA